jgi:hypothetical protein
LGWNNIHYNEEAEHINTKNLLAALELVQWQMRPFTSMESLSEQIEFFVDVISDYQSDFGLFPKLFSAL